jgi:hypothetical protein
MGPQEKEDDLQMPTVYSYRKTLRPTCLAWQESKLGCSEEEGHEPELIHGSQHTEPVHLYRLVGVAVDKRPSGVNYKAVD